MPAKPPTNDARTKAAARVHLGQARVPAAGHGVQKQTAPSIIAAGYAPLDIVQYQGRRWYAAGGTAGNVAAILGFLGWDSSLVADYGDDAAARRITHDLQTANVSLQYVRLDPAATTPRLVHDIDHTGHRYRFRCPDCSRSFPMSRPLTLARARAIIDLAPSADVFFFDRCNAGTLLLAEHFASRGSLVVFEPSRAARPDWNRRALMAANIVKSASDRDTGLANATPRAKQSWVLTGGASGVTYRYGPNLASHAPAFSYPVVDAAGAGDWATAGLIHALAGQIPTRKTDLTDALHWAQALAAISCGSPGARGLARQQSAEAVLQAAQFVRAQHATPRPQEPAPKRRQSTPKDVCKVCLQPRSVPIDRFQAG
jgi:fructokinase